jgi:hypothetical protein
VLPTDDEDGRRARCRWACPVCEPGWSVDGEEDPHGKSSRFKGVSWDAQRGSWQAKVGINGKTTHLGRFADEEDAARAYDAAAVAAFGAYARTNFTTGDS